MSQFMDTMFAKAQSDIKTIVLPEGNDVRTLQAAEEILAKGIANLIIIGNPDEIGKSGYDLTGASIIDNKTDESRGELGELLYEIRKAKGMTLEEAMGLMDDEVYFGMMLIKTGKADGLVSGACHSTRDILSPALRIIKTAPGSKLVSSFFIMNVPNCQYGDNGTFMFSDCGVNINPNADELSEIAIATAQSYERIIGAEPKVALLSHSTYGSAKDDDAKKVIEATKLAKEKAPELSIDGELQADAALVASVGKSKAPGSSVAGQANCLIFPDLDAGNIGYKLVQRLAGAEAYGPVTQGIAAPVNDLSRGCSAADIVGVVAITAVQAQNN